jgi:para-aminobenzoate synthetase component I
MDGVLATDLIEISSDPQSLDDGGFWAVLTTFEGGYTFAKFGSVRRSVSFPEVGKWIGLDEVWESSISRIEYEEHVETIRSEIKLGNVYQVNACRILRAKVAKELSLAPLFASLLANNPAPNSCYLRLPDIEVASASPELFISRSKDQLKTSPIKGTRDLREVGTQFSEKEKAENIMIVDLMRNDFGRICKPGSVKVSELLRSELHPGLEHLVSDIVGEVNKDITWEQFFAEILPPGSVSGTPKYTALKIIQELEPTKRGPYCGALGWVQGGDAYLSVGIRLFWKTGEEIRFGTGAGITWDSKAIAEWEETELKAAKLLSIAGGLRPDGWPFGSGLFETLRVEDGRAQLFDLHIERARKSAEVLGYEIPPDVEIIAAIGNLADIELGRLRLTFGESFQVALDPYIDSIHPAKLGIRHLSLGEEIKSHKIYPYTKNLTLLTEARVDGFDEVVVVNDAGRVCEGAVSNYVFRIDGLWMTPALTSGILPGIIRGFAISSGLAIESEIMLTDLEKVTHAFALSSLRIAQPISEIAGRKLQIDEIGEQWGDKLRQILRSH